MEIIVGLLIIAIGAFCQSSSYVPINRIKSWSWESYWLVQGVFAWLLFPLLGALLAVPEGHSLTEIYAAHPQDALKSLLAGILWGIGGLTFGLSMRYLGIALGQSIALGTCAGLGTLLTPVFTGQTESLTLPVWIGVAVTLMGIAVIGYAGSLKSTALSDEEKRKAVKDFNFSKGLIVALLAGFMSACFSIGLGFGESLCFEQSADIYRTLPATLMVTLGGFLTNAAYCLWQNRRNSSWSDYRCTSLYANNLLFCSLAGALWYSQFFGLSLGKGFLASSPVLLTFSWCILMSLNVTFSNVWGILLKEWKGCSARTVTVLVIGLLILILSSFLPQLLETT
ncbi:MAG: L-rhamnose/proton symporter RhaT [Mediterranea sp.]|nr:L-rhamnose/proton symporter RhaT [Mediterranea sp.]